MGLMTKLFGTYSDRERTAIYPLVDKVEALFRDSRENLECDFCNGAGLQISHEGIVVKLIEKLMQNSAGNIPYFIYELDYGFNI